MALALATALLAGPAFAQQPGAAQACTDFHAFANADWLAANPPGVATSAMAQLHARAQAQTRQLLDAAMQAPQGPLEEWLGAFWASGLDEAAGERVGAQPLAPLLAQIDGVRRARQLGPAIAALHKAGVPVLFGFGPVPAADGSLAAGFSQGGLALTDPAFLTREGAGAEVLRARYRDYVQRILELSGVPAAQAAAQTRVVIDIETRIARESRPLSLLRAEGGRVASLPVAGLDRQYPRLAPEAFLRALGVEAGSVLADPQLLVRLDAMLGQVDPAQWRSYLRFQLGNAMAPYLGKAWRDAHFAMHGSALRGLERTLPAADRTLATLNGLAGPVLGQAYAQRHAPAPTLVRAGEVAAQVRAALVRGIERSAWLSGQARSAARAKLDALAIEVGTPGAGIDPASLPALDRGNFAANVLAVAAWRQRQDLARIGRDRSARPWPVPAHLPALAYQPDANLLVVTAAMLQPPVFDPGWPAAAQFGAFGAMVGHELTHAVDAQGRLRDAAGDAGDWWQPADLAAWEARVARFTAQYVAFPIPDPPGIAFDSRRIAAENIADLSGVELAAEAFAAAAPGADATAQQAFHRGWARLWAQRLPAGQASAVAATAVHPPGYWRADGPLRNLPGFAAAHGCKARDPMVAGEDERLQLWR
ncbi:MAG: M13-type metalloendopeptidase [Gammaproteobacteria bacterium]